MYRVFTVGIDRAGNAGTSVGVLVVNSTGKPIDQPTLNQRKAVAPPC
jgi:hypothetical protein